jgi:hypothetical protein
MIIAIRIFQFFHSHFSSSGAGKTTLLNVLAGFKWVPSFFFFFHSSRIIKQILLIFGVTKNICWDRSGRFKRLSRILSDIEMFKKTLGGECRWIIFYFVCEINWAVIKIFLENLKKIFLAKLNQWILLKSIWILKIQFLRKV